MREIAHGRPRRAGPWWPHLLTLPACAVLAASTALLTACGDGADGERATQGAADLGRDGGGNPASDLGGAGADLGPAQRDGGGADGAAAPDLGVEDLGPAADGTADAQADGGPPLPPDQAVLLGVALGGSWVLPGLQQEAHLLLTEAGVPHIYAASKADLGRVLGFVFARDRYFLLEAQRRMALGTLSELFGQDALAMDAESRMLGMAYLAERLTAALDGEMAEYADALAAGINAYIEQVRTGALPPPKELQLAAVMLGLASPAELMRPFDRRDVAALGAVIFYETNFETDDVGRTAEVARLAGLFAGAARGGLRRQGFLADIWNDLRPLFDRSSAAGFGLEQGGDGDGGGGGEGAGAGGQPAAARGKPGRGAAAREARWQLALPQLPGRLPPALLDRAARRLQRVQQRLGRDFAGGFGSNAWAVAGRAAVGGRALLAGDGHLRLSVPSLMYQVALDTRVFGGGETHQIGLLLAGLPVMGVGTNGEVAYSMVNPMVDITDWYREELQLSEDGLPRASRFAGEWRPLSAQVERFVVADVPLLGSAGRTESWTRWTTFDGRWIAEIEGRQAVPDEVLGPGEALVNLQGELVVPGDIDGDGVVTALSFDYTAFDATAVLRTWDRFGHARDVHELREQTRGLVGVGLFLAAADAAGDVLYSSYQAIPCRGYLPRDEAGGWAPGADPTILLDGTRFGGFTIPTRDGLVDEAPGRDDPYACAIPFAEMPQALSPPRGYVVTANSDPGGLMSDGSISNDRWYLGGIWCTVRTDSIAGELERAIAAGAADLEAMERIQGHTRSRLGELYSAALVQAIEAARTLAGRAGERAPHEARLAALYRADAAAYDEVAERLRRWAEQGFATPAGVETFYHQLAPGEGEDAVATTIFNAWLGRFLGRVFDDERMPWRFSSSMIKTAALKRFLLGRGPGNPQRLASYDPETGESVFFDVLGTEAVERSEEVALLALADALAFLRSAPLAPGQGGFGTPESSAWLWGLRHQARFRSLLGEFLGDDPAFAALVEQFSITTATLPLAEALPAQDPRRQLSHFPRPGDQWAVDAANPGFSGTDFTYSTGPVMRMVVELGPEGMSGRNIVPGGQVADPASPHFADQARLWLANRTLPMRFTPVEVAEGATRRELFRPER